MSWPTRVPRVGGGAGPVIADRAYATGVIRTELRRRRITAVIPPRATRSPHESGARKGGDPRVRRRGHKGRNVVERSSTVRGLATRYDKLASLRAADVIFTILTWLRT